MNKKAFSLVELAMVLVVIGVLVVMSIKAYSTLNSARVKQQLSSIDKIGSALSTYHSLYGILPGDDINYPSGIISMSETPEAARLLIQADLLGPSDFEVRDLRGKVFRSWLFVHCIEDNAAGYGYYGASRPDPIVPRGNICLATSDSTSVFDMNSGTPEFPEGHLAGYELYIDDAHIRTGLGRGGHLNYDNSTSEFISLLGSVEPAAGYYMVKIW